METHLYMELIRLMRIEMEKYGSLATQLESQRQALLSQDMDSVMQLSTSIFELSDEMSKIRMQREQAVRQLSTVPAPHSLSQLLASTEHETKPLIEELVREINRLVGACRNQLQRNQMLFRRIRDIGQNLITSIVPEERRPQTYRRNGLNNYAATIRRSNYVQHA